MLQLRRIAQTYYVRFAIPKDRWPDFGGKREVVRTLQTGDVREARRHRSAAVQAIENELNADLPDVASGHFWGRESRSSFGA